MRADARRDDGDDEEQDGKDGEARQRLARWPVVLETRRIGGVHADELEEEVAQSDEVEDDDDDHAGDGLAADPPCG